MNPDSTIEYNSLSWVKKQLDDVLADAQSNLNEYIENKSKEDLENCVEHLQLIYGTLQMVEVYGASMLAEEMQRTASALLAGDVEREEDTFDVLMRAMLQLPDYLEGIQAGKKDTPISLMPLINDLRVARKEGLLTESVLFSPNVESAILTSDEYDEASIDSGKLQSEVKRLRTHYQLGLLDYIRNNKQQAGLKRIKAVMNALEKVSSDAEVRRLWMVVSALVEGLLNDGIKSNLSIKTLLGNIDRQLKQVLDDGEEAFVKNYSKENLKNILYYIGGCSIETKTIAAVKQAYNLSELMPQEADSSIGLVGGLNADLFATVSKGITEDLDQVKDVLELFMHSSEQNLDQLVPIAEQLGKIADTYGMLSMGATRQSMMEQRTVLESIINGEVEVSEKVVLGIASELLNAESELKNYIAERSGISDIGRQASDENAIPAAEYRQVVLTVVTEGLRNFSDAKEAILSYMSGIGDNQQLEAALHKVEEVRGVSMMIPMDRVEAQIVVLQNYIRSALLNNHHEADLKEQDAVADLVTSIEYFLEALSEGRPGVEHGLDAGDKAAEIIQEVANRYEGKSVPQSGSSDAVDGVAVDDEVDKAEQSKEEKTDVQLSDAVSSKQVSSEGISDSAASQRSSSTKVSLQQADIENYAILSEDADEEIVEIFIEEAIEVLGELNTYYPQWKANSDDEEALAVVRRSFHTLKGSGRLLGAELIGEFSWKFENMLNRVIDKKITVSDSLFLGLDEALAVLPQLIEQLKGNREPITNMGQLMAYADAVADGKDVDYLGNSGGEANEQAAEDTGAVEIKDGEIEVEGLLEDVDEDIQDDIVISIAEDDESGAVDVPSGSDTGLELSDDSVTFETDQTEQDEIEIDLSAQDAESVGNDDLIKFEDTASDGEAGEVDSGIDVDTASEAQEEIIDLSSGVNDGDFEIVIDEEVGVPLGDGEMLDIDPMLLKIYNDESQEHLATVKQLLDQSEAGEQLLLADKPLMRAFHTLYGSARTAEVESVAELCGSAEKYVKTRQQSGDGTIPADIFPVFREVEIAITKMLEQVAEGKVPAGDKKLHEKLNKIVQQEIQSQLQRSWQDNSSENVAESGSIEEISIQIDSEQAENDIAGEARFEQADQIDSDGMAEDIVNSSAESEADISEPEAPSIVEQEEEIVEEEVLVSYGDIDDELIDIFLEEAEELLENCENTLNDIEAAPNSTEHIHQLQRNMHTLKGGARMADLKPIGDLTHNLESLVVMVEENKVASDKRLFDLLHESLDELTELLGNVKARQPLKSAVTLNKNIGMLMRGETSEKRSVERFDVDLTELESVEDDTDIDELLSFDPDNKEGQEEQVNDLDEMPARRKTDATEGKETPHWGERASDVNFKDSQEQVRVRSDLLNNLVNSAGEVNIYHARMGKQVSDFSFNLSELSSTVVRLKEQLRKLEIETEIQIRSGYEKEHEVIDDSFDPLEMDQYSTLQQLTRSLSETAGDVESINGILADIMRDSETLLLQESRVSTDLQEGLMRTRMVRFGGLSSRLRRIVRQVSNELGKEVELEIIGENSDVDRTVLDRIIAPLEHMLRNAIAHGIEMPSERKALRKSETGKIKISVSRQGTSIVINVEDDGAGIDVNKIRSKAIKVGYIERDSALSDHDILQFILQSGFSTADEVSQVAGRGVGMDVVDSEIKQLGGVLDIDTRPGEGTLFNVRLPLTLAINQALLVSTIDDVFAIPLASIEGVVRITGVELQQFYDSDNTHYEFNGIEYELKHLGGLLTGKQGNYEKQLQLFPVLLVKVGDQHFALHVEDLIGRREIVVKPVGMQIGAVRGIAGATILADGRVVLILEMSALVVAESLFKPHEPVEEIEEVVSDAKKTIMVVDDSITIRKVTERMLHRYGIEVILAKDGVDATNQLQEKIPDLMLLDIEMPRMDGFEVARYVRNDERLENLPIIMITSRTGSKHKEKAMEIGVDRYLGKPFQEEDLLNNINTILKTSF